MDVGTLPNHVKSCILSSFFFIAIFINNYCKFFHNNCYQSMSTMLGISSAKFNVIKFNELGNFRLW